MKLIKIPFFILLVIFFGATAHSQNNVQNSISLAIKSGNAGELAKYFNENIELVILEKENIYSKTQAEQILKNFFNQHTPVNFKIVHQGGDESRYAIGTLDATNGSYRVYFLLKSINGQSLIHQLRIEDDN